MINSKGDREVLATDSKAERKSVEVNMGAYFLSAIANNYIFNQI